MECLTLESRTEPSRPLRVLLNTFVYTAEDDSRRRLKIAINKFYLGCHKRFDRKQIPPSSLLKQATERDIVARWFRSLAQVNPTAHNASYTPPQPLQSRYLSRQYRHVDTNYPS